MAYPRNDRRPARGECSRTLANTTLGCRLRRIGLHDDIGTAAHNLQNAPAETTDVTFRFTGLWVLETATYRHFPAEALFNESETKSARLDTL